MSLYGYNRKHGRRVSINSSTSNLSTRSETSLPWTTKDVGFNAISGIVNNPNTNLSSSAGKPSKYDIPVVAHTPIRRVKPSDFQNYVKSITPVFEQYNRNKGIGAARQKTVKSFNDSFDAPESSIISKNLDLPISSLLENPSKEGCIELSLLEIVPPIYFEEDFNLENPRTFDLVCEQAEIIGGNGGTSANAILQEKLSHYLDTVEVHLVQEISKRSSSFFAALSNLQALHSETLECVSQIHALREKLVSIDDSEAKKGLQVVRLKRRRANLGRLYEGIRMVAEIRSTQPMIQVLLSQGDYFSALDLIEESKKFLQGNHYSAENEEKALFNTKSSIITTKTSRPQTILRRLSNVSEGLKSGSVDLRGVRALVHFSSHLAEMHKTIGVMMENDLLNMIFLDFEEHIDNVDKGKVVNSLYEFLQIISPIKKSVHPVPSILLESSQKETKLRERISPLVVGIYKINRFSTTLLVYRERLLKEVKKLIQKHYPSNLPLNEPSDSFAKLLKGMSFDAFMEILLAVYALLFEAIKRIAIYNDLFVSILNDLRIADVEGRNKIELIKIKKENQEMIQQENGSESQSIAQNVQNEQQPILSGSKQSKLIGAQKITSGIKSIIQKASSSTLGLVPSVSQEPTPVQVITGDTTISQSATHSDDIYAQLITESCEIVFAAADLAHMRCAKLIAERAEPNARLNPKDFYRLFDVTWAFVLGGESLCGRMCIGLRGTIMSQAKSFLKHFHMEKMNSAASVIENEQWVQTLIPVDFQRMVDRIVSAATIGMDGFKDNLLADLSLANPLSPSYLAPPMQFPTNTDTVIMTNSPTNNFISNRYISIEGNHQFTVVACSLMMIKTLGEYLRCMANIPSLTTEAMNRIVEILKLFNSRICQVILGAGAMKSAGLKNITAKHLALASQSLGVIISLIPYIRECIRHNLKTKQAIMLTEFDKTKRDYLDHQQEIHNKLVSIMDERLVDHMQDFRKVNWDEPESKPIEGPNVYMEKLVRETTTLHRVLNKYLHPEVLERVMGQVFQSFNTKLAQEMAHLEILTAAGKQRLLVDVQYYIQKLSNLEGIQGPTTFLENAAQNLNDRDNEHPLSINGS
ncbi:hypothetical protein G9A89_008176 [Geosiphon pyriformis]|nr:hypothetical protein G9A89_008176 [Geosiphon pyriformis]